MNRNTFNAMAAQYAVKTLSGKNLADLVSLFGDGYTNTANGVTVMVKDGYAVFSGQHTNTGWTNVLFATASDRSVVFPAGTYSIPNSLVCAFRTMSGNSSVGNKTGTFTLDEECYLTQCYVAFLGVQTVNAKVPLIVVQGTQIPVEYEPYCPNGIRQWNNGVRCVLPEVQIGGKVEQTYSGGNNRLELDGKTVGDEVTVVYDHITQIFTLNGTKTRPGNLVLSTAANILWDGAEKFWTVRQKVGGSVTLDASGGRYLLWSVFTNDYSAYTCRTKCIASDEDKEFVANNASGASKIEQSPAGSGYRIMLQCLNCSAENPIVFDNYQVRLMITELDTSTLAVPTEYEPYTGGVSQVTGVIVAEGTTVTVEQRNNLFDTKSVIGFGPLGSQAPQDNIGSISDDVFVVRRSVGYSTTLWLGAEPYLKAGTYTFSADCLIGSVPETQLSVAFQVFRAVDGRVPPNADGNHTALYASYTNKISAADTWERKSWTFTLNQDGDIMFALQPSGGPVNYDGLDCRFRNVILNAGATEMGIDNIITSTAVAPRLAAIPNTQYVDTWNPQTGKGVRRIGVQRFDGTEAWYAYNTTSVALENWCGKKDIQRSYDKPSGYLCNIAKAGINGNPDVNDGTFVTHNVSSANWIVFHTNMPLAEWKAYLAAQHVAGTPVTVWYALAEPVEFQTDSQPLTAPHGSVQIVQTGGTVDGVPITVKYVTHS